jgi:SAM-dependent methyltransferase
VTEGPAREVYTHGHAEPVLRVHRWRTAANSAGYLLPRLAPGQSVLDVGCGPGSITADLARLVAPGSVVGLDAVAAVVSTAAAEHRAPNLSFRVGDVYALDDDDASFDVVHAHQVLQHLADPVAALRELWRVCRPGGTIAVRDGDFGAMTWWPDLPGLHRWRDIYCSVARANGGEPDAGRRLLSWVRAAGVGLHAVSASAAAWCFSTPEDRAWWAGNWAERMTGPPLAERALELGVASAADLAECADVWTAWAAHPDAVFLVPHAEVLIRR